MTKHIATADLAKRAYEASGCKTHPEFIGLFAGAISLRSFRAWLAGEVPAAPIAQLLLREFADGWRPRVAMANIPAVATFLALSDDIASTVDTAAYDRSTSKEDSEAFAAERDAIYGIAEYLKAGASACLS